MRNKYANSKSEKSLKTFNSSSKPKTLNTERTKKTGKEIFFAGDQLRVGSSSGRYSRKFQIRGWKL
jgi:hypothetical protein